MPFLALAVLAVQVDRLDLPPKLDSYYAVVRGDKTLGIMRETLERVHGEPWRYAYKFRLELDAAPGIRDDFSADASLDDAFLPLYAGLARWRGAAVSESWILPAGEGRKLDRAGELVDLPAEDRALTTLAVYALRQTGRLARPGLVRARLLPGEEIEIEVGPAEKRDVLGRSGTVTKLAFPKPPAAASADFEWVEAWADRFGRLVEIRLRGGARIVLIEGQAALAKLGWLPRDGRRDPLARPARTGRPKIDGLVLPEVTADTVESLIRDLGKRVSELRRLKDEQLLPEGETVYRKFLGLEKALRAKGLTAPQAAAVAEHRERAEDVWGGAARAREAARALLVRAMAGLEDLRVAEMERDLAQLRALADAPELEGRPERHDVLLWIAETRTLVARARVRKDLATAPLLVSGTTLSDTSESLPLDLSVQFYGHRAGDWLDVPFVRHEVYAVVNGEAYRPGDVIRGTSIRLEKISRNSVSFSLRDELRDVPLR